MRKNCAHILGPQSFNPTIFTRSIWHVFLCEDRSRGKSESLADHQLFQSGIGKVVGKEEQKVSKRPDNKAECSYYKMMLLQMILVSRTNPAHLRDQNDPASHTAHRFSLSLSHVTHTCTHTHIDDWQYLDSSQSPTVRKQHRQNSKMIPSDLALI